MMINWKMISRIMGSLLLIETVLLLGCAGLSAFYGESDCQAFLVASAATLVAGLAGEWGGLHAERKLNRRGGYVIVSMAWVAFSVFGMLPYIISGYIPSVTDAFFETMSGFTTTGASILDNIESLPHGLLFWRSMTQWIGGLGIIFFTIAVLPIFGMGGVQLFAAEATGPTHDKVHPRIGVTAKWIWSIYLGLTLLLTVLLMGGGMDLFDSLNHAMTTTATGGYSTRQASVSAYHSAYIEYMITLFMFLSGINFTLIFSAVFKGHPEKLYHDTEFRWYLGLVLGFSAFIAVTQIAEEGWGVEESIRAALFQVVSIITTTGFMSSDYTTWAPGLAVIVSIVMCLGACAGSTSGGIKCVRIAIMSRVARNEFKRIVHPNAVLPVRVNGRVVSPTSQATILAFVFIYILLFLSGWIVMAMSGMGFAEAYSVSLSSLGNVGPGLGSCGPSNSWSAIPDVAKWVSALLMLIGRLELFTILLLFTPGFWKKH
jgi:trk system potassium uptake protein TrkH